MTEFPTRVIFPFGFKERVCLIVRALMAMMIFILVFIFLFLFVFRYLKLRALLLYYELYCPTGPWLAIIKYKQDEDEVGIYKAF